MKTDDLIASLAKDPAPPASPSLAMRLARAALIGAALALAGLLATLGVRDELMRHAGVVLAKAGFSAALAAAALPLLVRLARPGRPLGWRLLALGGGLIGSALIGCIALLGVDAGARLSAWTGGGFPWCLVVIPLLATPVAGFVMWLMRDLAPTRLALTGAGIGGFAGGIGALIYAAYCPIDSFSFVATWYAVAIGVCAGLGALAGARFLRW